MDEKEKLFGLVAIAQEQQKAVQVAIDTLTSQTAELKKTIGAVNQAAGEGAERATKEILSNAAYTASEAFKDGANRTIDRLLVVSEKAEDSAEHIERVTHNFHTRWMILAVISLLTCLMIFMSVSWLAVAYKNKEIKDLTAQRNDLETELASLEKRATEWENKAGKAVLSKCGEKGRLCVRIDTKSGGFVSDNGKHEYAVIYGY